MAKVRELTAIQKDLLALKARGLTNESISHQMNLHPVTISCKLAAIRRGIKKGAYAAPATDDLFSGDTAP